MSATVAPSAPTTTTPRRAWGRAGVIVVGLAVLAGLTVLSLFVGSGGFSIDEVLAALRGEGTATTVALVQDFRVPRTVLAIVVGAALGVAGAVMQALMRNPLADPGILGVNAGAYTAVVLAAAVLGSSLTTSHVLVALVGALLVSIVVYGIGTTGVGAGTPTKLVLTGSAVGAVLTGVSFAITLMLPEVFDRVRFWSAGSLQNRQWDSVWAILPFIVVGLVLALALIGGLNAIALGDDVAVALGARPGITKAVGAVAITLLCGAATAGAGPIAFIGLLVPHALRSIVGPDQRWIVPLALIAAPILMLTADIVGRVAVSSELPAGVVSAFIGAPVLIALATRKGARSL